MNILMKNYIDLGFTKVYFYSLMILIGMALGIFLVYREFKRQGYDVKTLEDITNNGQIRYQLKMFVRNKKETR